MAAPFRVIRALERKLERSRAMLPYLESNADDERVEDEREFQAELVQALDALHALDDEDGVDKP